jgi:CHAT domain-containing protein
MGTEKENYWRNQTFDAKQSYDSLIRALAKNYPRYHQLKYNTAAIPLAYLQKKVLDENEVLLEYFWGNNNIFLFLIDGHNMHLFRLAYNEQLLRQINTVRNIIAQRKEQLVDFSENAYQLYAQLVGPVDSLIQNKDLLIIPDGPLSYLPFEVLPDQPPLSAMSFFGFPYLVKNHSIHYAFSATILAQNVPARKENTEARYLAFAPKFNGQNSDLPQNNSYPVSFITTDTVRSGLVPLKGAVREIAAISQLMEGDLYEGEAAHEAAFKQYAENYDILHLATHAIVDDRHSLNSRMLFTVTDDTTEDGNLYVWELYNMQLNAQMAVLSACNTGFGKLQRGEGVMSLGRAFAYAGCPSVIMSLWPAQDQATADLMSFFYQALDKGMPKDEALRQAKLQYLATTDELFAHPFYWAGFVAQGDPHPLNTQNLFSTKWLTGGIFALLLLFIAFFQFKKR